MFVTEVVTYSSLGSDLPRVMASRDWAASATPELIAARTLAGAKPGAILLLHDSDGSSGAPGRTLAALPGILAGLRERGLEPVTLSQLVTGESGPGRSV